MARIDHVAMRKRIMQNVTLTICMPEIQRNAFGRWNWRLRLAKLLAWLLCRVLRCGLEWEGIKPQSKPMPEDHHGSDSRP